MPIVSELREVIGALQSEVEFEAVVSELGAAGIDRARMSFLAQEDIAASCAGAGYASGVGYRGWCGRAGSFVRAATRSPRARVGREPDPQRRHRVDRQPR